MTDSQNDTSELDLKDLISEAIYSVPYNGLKPGEDERVDYHVRVIAQREQAAELRGRIDELELLVSETGHHKVVEYGKGSVYSTRERLATLQATNPEKGKRK